MAIKIERARIHFLSDIFTLVANVGSVILPTEHEVLTPVSEVSRIQRRIRGPGPGGLRILPSRPDACLRLKFLHRRDRISLFNWLIFLTKDALHFATKQNSWDIKKCDCFWALLPLLAKQYFPRQRRPTLTEEDIPRVHPLRVHPHTVRGQKIITCIRGRWEGGGGVLSEPKF